MRAAHRAASLGNAQALRLLFEFQPALANAKDKRRRTPLHDAVEAGSIECIELLLAAGADPALSDRDGTAALHVAAECKGGEPVVRLLLSRGVDIHARMSCAANLTALHLAAGTDPALVRTLLEFGADAHATERSWGVRCPSRVHRSVALLCGLRHSAAGRGPFSAD